MTIRGSRSVSKVAAGEKAGNEAARKLSCLWLRSVPHPLRPNGRRKPLRPPEGQPARARGMADRPWLQGAYRAECCNRTANAVNTNIDLWVTIDDQEMARWGL